MIVLSALWLALVQALASPAAPAGVGAPVDVPARIASVGATSGAGATVTDRARTERVALASPMGDGEFRPPAHHRRPAIDRAAERSIPPLRSAASLAAFVGAALALLVASIAPPAAQRVSYAASRGDHLPYFSTPPPVRR